MALRQSAAPWLRHKFHRSIPSLAPFADPTCSRGWGCNSRQFFA
jgi:hypothetical protein